MKKFITLSLVFCVFLTLLSCANSKPTSEPETAQEQTATAPESPLTAANPNEIIEFFGETYFIDEADYVDYDENGNVTFVLFHNIGFIGLADGDAEPLYQQVKLGQVIGGATVSEGTSMGFDFTNGKWELTESDVMFTGSMTFAGELTKTPKGELEFLAPGILTFTATDSESGFMPFKYGFDNAPQFILDGYNPGVDYPELFSESDTVYVRATFDWLRLFKTERATGANWAKLVSVELMEPVKTEEQQFLSISLSGTINGSHVEKTFTSLTDISKISNLIIDKERLEDIKGLEMPDNLIVAIIQDGPGTNFKLTLFPATAPSLAKDVLIIQGELFTFYTDIKAYEDIIDLMIAE